ncbi:MULTISPECIES: hypothetical protein [Burkholderiales]|uniref:hypothetical protein n=1 Tax=Burkholderiales TaxID=80840 RepID=UPI0006C44A6A|nr:hypothetical protein [Achromobacter sp. 2789STDY5608621]MCG2599693.1 hypothetical protein [Achromobacter sp.]MCG2604464.1 hypothetical protein [Achromobacter sp.]CUJ76649.1 Uncharacterised protein [Achromobacter sp. 2789STDY5608621]
MSRFLRGVCDLLLLVAVAALYGACLTAKLQTGAYGLAIPDAPYTYERADFLIDAVFAGLVALAALIVAERLWRRRAPGRGRVAVTVLTFVAALLAMYLGMPDPRVFGNTWARWEPTFELFLHQWDIVLPLALAAAAARRMWRAPRRSA